MTPLFIDVIGHAKVVALLERELDRPVGSYLFTGPAGVGKSMVALRFAAGLMCPAGAEHAETCATCRRVLAGTHPDVVMVEPEGSVNLTVDQARTAITQATLTPLEAPRKVFVVDEAHTMTDQAANALLKTLEEPSASSVFVLVTESEDDLPPTVASRCRVVRFGRVDDETIAEHLISAGVDGEQARSAARVAGGRPGLALTLSLRPEVAQFRANWLLVPGRLSSRPGESIHLADTMLATIEPLLTGFGNKATKDKPAQERTLRRARSSLLVSGLEILASFYTDAASLQYGGPTRNGDLGQGELTAVDPVVAVKNAGRILDAMADLRANLRPTLILANLFGELADAG